jgi:dTDP-4-dehydrorhamnose reductase
MWLVVGSGGQLGRCMTDLLAHKSIPYMGASHRALDIGDREEVMDFVVRIRPSFILNAAAWTNVDSAEDNEAEATRVNGEGAGNLAEAAKRCGARLIHVSTDYVFDGLSSTPYSVDDSTLPINAYGRSKLVGEVAVHEIGEGLFPIVRTAWLYSKYGQNLLTTFAAKAMGGEAVRVVDNQVGQPTSAHDLANFLLRLSSLEKLPPIIHGTNSGSASRYEFVREVYASLGADTELVSPVGHDAFPMRAQRPMYSVLGHDDLVSHGITPMQEWKKGLAQCIPLLPGVAKKAESR